MTGDLAYQLQTLGRAESDDAVALAKAAERLNAQNVDLFSNGETWVLTCDPQPQDCGPLR